MYFSFSLSQVLGGGVEGGERAHGGEQHRHRVGVVAEALHRLLDVLVHVGVVDDHVHPVVERVLARQLAVHQQVGDLEVAGVLAQVLDRDAAVLQHARLAVDVGDRAPAGRGVRVRRVVGHEAEVVLVDLHLAEVHRLHRAVGDLHLERLAGPVVGHRQRVLSHGGHTDASCAERCSSRSSPSRAAAPPTTATARARFEEDGFDITFEYPEEMNEANNVQIASGAGSSAKATAGVGYGEKDTKDVIIVQRYDLNRAIGEDNLDRGEGGARPAGEADLTGRPGRTDGRDQRLSVDRVRGSGGREHRRRRDPPGGPVRRRRRVPHQLPEHARSAGRTSRRRAIRCSRRSKKK